MIETKLRKRAEKLDKHAGYMTHCGGCDQLKYFPTTKKLVENSHIEDKIDTTLYKIRHDKFQPLRCTYYCSEKCRTTAHL